MRKTLTFLSLICFKSQILGLTATPGTGKAKSQYAAEDHVLQLCANLDVQHISVVEQNQNTLQERINVPVQGNCH